MVQKRAGLICHIANALKTTSLSSSIFILIWQNRGFFFQDRIYSPPPSRTFLLVFAVQARFDSSASSSGCSVAASECWRPCSSPLRASLRTWRPLRGGRSKRSGDGAQPRNGGFAVPPTGRGQQALPFAFSSGAGDVAGKTKLGTGGVVASVPGGMRRPVFPCTASSVHVPGRPSSAGLWSLTHSPQPRLHLAAPCRDGHPYPSATPVPDPPRPTGSEG